MPDHRDPAEPIGRDLRSAAGRDLRSAAGRELGSANGRDRRNRADQDLQKADDQDPGTAAEEERRPAGPRDDSTAIDRRRRLGAAGEQLAAEHLVRRGFQVLDRNYRTRWGELDIVASDGQRIVFCEVKCRVANRAGRDPLESVHPSKQLQVRRMAARWLSERQHPPVGDLRFDAIGVTLSHGGRLLRLDHVEAAF